MDLSVFQSEDLDEYCDAATGYIFFFVLTIVY